LEVWKNDFGKRRKLVGGFDDSNIVGSGPVSFTLLVVVDDLCRSEPGAVIVYRILRGGADFEETVLQITSPTIEQR
jgi:hypothetical protein